MQKTHAVKKVNFKKEHPWDCYSVWKIKHFQGLSTPKDPFLIMAHSITSEGNGCIDFCGGDHSLNFLHSFITYICIPKWCI